MKEDRTVIYPELAILMSTSSATENEPRTIQVRRVTPDDVKTFTVCTISQDWGTAPVLGPKGVAEMAADGAVDFTSWQDGRHLCFHVVRDTAGHNDFATGLADRVLTGLVYIVVTGQDHSMMDFPADIFDVLSRMHADRPTDEVFLRLGEEFQDESKDDEKAEEEIEG